MRVKKVGCKILKKENSQLNNKVQVFFLISSLKRCGPVNVIFSLISKLDFTRFTPMVFTFKKETEISRLDEFHSLGIEVVQCSGILEFILQLKKHKKRQPQVILHSHGFIPDLINYLFFDSQDIKVSTLHNFPFEDYPMTFGSVKGRIMASLHLSMEKRLVCVACSDTIKEQIQKKYSMSVLSIANGVKFTPITKRRFNSKKFLYLGSIDNRKNVTFLLRMFASNSLSHCSLSIVGDGPLYASLKEKYGQVENIEFYGHADNPEYYLRANDYLVSASLSEGLPMAVLEGLSHGLPVLLSDIPSHSLIVNSGNFGSVFHVNDNDFAEKVDKLLIQKFDRRVISKEAYELYSDVTMTSRYEDLYQKLVNEKKRRPIGWSRIQY